MESFRFLADWLTGQEPRGRSAERRLGAFQGFQKLAETVLGAPVHGELPANPAWLSHVDTLPCSHMRPSANP